MVSVPLLGCLSEPFEGEPPVVSARYETVALQLPAGTDDEEENDAGRHNHASQNGRFRTRRSVDRCCPAGARGGVCAGSARRDRPHAGGRCPRQRSSDGSGYQTTASALINIHGDWLVRSSWRQQIGNFPHERPQSASVNPAHRIFDARCPMFLPIQRL